MGDRKVCRFIGVDGGEGLVQGGWFAVLLSPVNGCGTIPIYSGGDGGLLTLLTTH